MVANWQVGCLMTNLWKIVADDEGKPILIYYCPEHEDKATEVDND